MRSGISDLAQRRGIRQFVKFAIVGASGLVVSGIIAHVLHWSTALSGFTDFAIGFMAGGVSNYGLNRIWTFRSQRNPAVEGVQFLAVSTIALLIGKGVFTLAPHLDIHNFTLTWLLATLGGTLVNFFLNKYWTFKHIT